MPGTAPKNKASRIITVGGPAGLMLGFLLGTLAHTGRAPWLVGLLTVTEPLGTIWMNALRVAVVPLTVCLLVVGVSSVPRGRTLGRWGSLTFAAIAGLLLAGALVTILVSQAAFAISAPSQLQLLSVEVDQAPVTNGDWAAQLMPGNLFEATVKGDILPLAVLSVLFGLALRTVHEERRRPVESVFIGVRDAVMAFVHWVILAIPLGAFALTFTFAVESGLDVARSLLHFVLFSSALMATLTLALCLAVVIGSRSGLRKMADALSPLVSVSIGTRSSLASLPTLIKSANDLGLPAPASEIVLPTCASLFKLNRTVSTTAKLLFLSVALGIAISPQALVVFVGTVFVLSFATPGLPSGGTNATWGAYMAAGIPVEALVVFDVASPLTDVFKTALNVVADFAVAVYVSRWAKPIGATIVHESPIEAAAFQ